MRLGARLLRNRLADDRGDEEIRRALVEIYRRAGHLDQAGRFALGQPYSNRAERDAYARYLLSIDADEARIRDLSLLPQKHPVPDGLVAEMARVGEEDHRGERWDWCIAVGFVAFFALSLITVVTVYFVVILGGREALLIARIGGVVSSGALAVVTLGFAGSAWARRRWIAAAAWTAATAGIVGSLVLVGVGLLVGRWS
ncbi:hypothetical protein LK09_09485 [Microbacterium mangrovi]|uniref:Uncharacterized protein n=1 Tax=Microbacterium mangrovi TaxID=1348253 RepID=A0A0B2A923_9MICO|nr:hypothetical protein LK09_09485 [Microbacterium mangrovi]